MPPSNARSPLVSARYRMPGVHSPGSVRTCPVRANMSDRKHRYRDTGKQARTTGGRVTWRVRVQERVITSLRRDRAHSTVCPASRVVLSSRISRPFNGNNSGKGLDEGRTLICALLDAKMPISARRCFGCVPFYSHTRNKITRVDLFGANRKVHSLDN